MLTVAPFYKKKEINNAFVHESQTIPRKLPEFVIFALIGRIFSYLSSQFHPVVDATSKGY